LLDLPSRNIDVCQVAQEKLVREEGAIRLAVFLFFVYLSSTIWDTPTAKVHNPVPWGDTIKCHAER
jgi:hypothetical protein